MKHLIVIFAVFLIFTGCGPGLNADKIPARSCGSREFGSTGAPNFIANYNNPAGDARAQIFNVNCTTDISSVTLHGQLTGGGGTVYLNIYIFDDASGSPGGTVGYCNFGITAGSPADYRACTLNSKVHLQAGNSYWIGTMAPAVAWYWSTVDGLNSLQTSNLAYPGGGWNAPTSNSTLWFELH